MPTATSDMGTSLRARGLQKLEATACETFLLCLSELPLESRQALKEMLDEFLEAESEADRREVALSIIEAIAPDGYFNVEDSIGLDQWAGEDPATQTAVEKIRRKKEAFAERVRDLMSRRGLSQQQLAESLGVTQPTINNIISGKHKPQPKTLDRLAKVLGVSPENLWE